MTALPNPPENIDTSAVEKRPVILSKREQAAQLAADIVAKMPRMHPAARRIIQEVITYREVTLADIIGPARQTAIIHARADIYARLRDERGYSLSKIGALFGRKHTTILRALRKWDTIKHTPKAAAPKQVKAVSLPTPPKPSWKEDPPKGPKIMNRKFTLKREQGRVQAIDAQIKRAEQYMQMGKVEALKEHRTRVIAEGLRAI